MNQKIRAIFNKDNVYKVGAATTLMVGSFMQFALAADGETPPATPDPLAALDIVGPMKKALNSTVTTTVECFSAVIPIGLTIFGCKYAWIKGTGFFAKLAK